MKSCTLHILSGTKVIKSDYTRLPRYTNICLCPDPRYPSFVNSLTRTQLIYLPQCMHTSGISRET